MSSPLVQTIGLTKQYRKGKMSVSALDGVDLSIEEKEIIGIVGPSGSGKTTLLNLVGGLDRPTQGKIVVGGTDLGQLGDSQLANYRLHRIGFIFQFYNLMPVLTAQENVELPMELANLGKQERSQRALELLRTVGLGERVNHTPDELSGGEQQRVAVARALANGPAVILGDEPTGDLDSVSAKELMGLVESLRSLRGVTFLLVTHDPIVVSKCDRAYAVRDGKIIREISKERVQGSEARECLDGLY